MVAIPSCTRAGPVRFRPRALVRSPLGCPTRTERLRVRIPLGPPLWAYSRMVRRSSCQTKRRLPHSSEQTNETPIARPKRPYKQVLVRFQPAPQIHGGCCQMDLALVYGTRFPLAASSLGRSKFSCPRHLVAWISVFQAEGVGSIPTGGAAAPAACMVALLV